MITNHYSSDLSELDAYYLLLGTISLAQQQKVDPEALGISRVSGFSIRPLYNSLLHANRDVLTVSSCILS